MMNASLANEHVHAYVHMGEELPMKTDRMTLLIAPEDKAAIAARAAALGLSVSELVRQAALAFDPEEARARAEVEVLLPDLVAAIDRIDASFDRMLARADAHEARMAHLESPAYREEVRERLWADPKIDWDHIAALRAGALHRQEPA
jgi:hypothetical protein